MMFSSKISVKQDWITSGKLATAHKHFNNHSELLNLPSICLSLSKTYKTFMHLSVQPLHLAHAFIKKVSRHKIKTDPLYFLNACHWSYCERFTHAFNF